MIWLEKEHKQTLLVLNKDPSDHFKDLKQDIEYQLSALESKQLEESKRNKKQDGLTMKREIAGLESSISGSLQDVKTMMAGLENAHDRLRRERHEDRAFVGEYHLLLNIIISQQPCHLDAQLPSSQTKVPH